MRLSGVGPAAFFWGTIFILGAQKPPLTWILPSYSGEDQKKKNKSLLRKYTAVASVLLLFFGGQFLLGGTKAFFGTDFVLTFRGED